MPKASRLRFKGNATVVTGRNNGMRAGARDGIVAFASGASSLCRDVPDLMVAISKPLCLNFQTICDLTNCRCATSDQVLCEQFSPP